MQWRSPSGLLSPQSEHVRNGRTVIQTLDVPIPAAIYGSFWRMRCISSAL